jgi:hypothetical protein
MTSLFWTPLAPLSLKLQLRKSLQPYQAVLQTVRQPKSSTWKLLTFLKVGEISNDQVAETLSTSVGDLSQLLPNIWSFNYQMGPQSYEAALSGTLVGSESLKLLPESNSAFSDHIDVLQQLLKARVRWFKDQPMNMYAGSPLN